MSKGVIFIGDRFLNGQVEIMTKFLMFTCSLSLGFVFFAVLMNAKSCDSKNSDASQRVSSAGDKLAKGVWGGQHIRFEVSDNGVDIEFDCAHGAIKQAIVLDSQGKFDVGGMYAAEHGGPVRRDEESNERAVHYAGTVQGDQLTLAISDPKTNEDIGSFTLTKGNEGRIRKCK